MTTIKAGTANDNGQNIVASLEYLKIEAQNLGSGRLHSILETALSDAKNLSVGHTDATSTDSEQVSKFLLSFVSQPEERQKLIVQTLSRFEVVK